MEPKVFTFAQSPSPAAVKMLIHSMSLAGYEFAIVNLINGSSYASLLNRFVKFEFESPIRSLEFRQRGAGK